MTTKGASLVLLSAALLGLTGCQNGAAPPPIVLGHVANLSGTDRAGKHAEQGIGLAVKQLADADRADEFADRALEVRHTDTRGQLDAYEAEAVRLVNLNRVAGLIGGRTPDELARLDRSHVAVLAPCGVRPPGVSNLVFALGMRPAQQAWLLARVAADLGVGEVVVLADERRDDFVNLADAFARQYTQARQGKAAVVVPLRYGKDAKWDELAKQIGAHKAPGALVFAGAARDYLELRRKQALALPLLFAGDDGDAANLEAAPGMGAIYFATAFAPDRDTPRAQAFVQKYREAFKEEPDVAAALGYEAVQLYAEALKQISPTFTSDKLLAALREIKDFPGLAGPLTMTPDQHVRRPLFVMRQNGATVAVQRRYAAAALP